MRNRPANAAPLRGKGRYVLYWMTAFRRLGYNFALQRAAELARERRVPLVILEALRAGYRWRSERIDAFIVDGMREHAAALKDSKVFYYPYLEPNAGDGKGLLEALAAKAVAVVTDDFPCFFHPRMIEAAAGKLDVRLEAVDANGLLPLAATERVFVSAYQFRRFLQKAEFDAPEPDPLEAPLVAAEEVELKRWPRAKLPGPSEWKGGHAEAVAALRRFKRKLGSYAEERNHPDEDATSGLSPWLHFGQIGTHEIVEALAPGRPVFTRKDGRKGEEAVDAFFDQLVTWRELGFNFSHKRPDYDRYESLPGWARATLEKHAGDRREFTYSREDFEAAKTHDALWNAAQTQLVREGRLHNYMRMLWGKKILEWSASPREALETMIELNNAYGLDGRDPNSYSGIFWCLGRYDRPWGPERPVFGTVRYMSSEAARRKLRLESWLSRYA
jgi:deoxyribodipyrimidine photo-lyase